MSESEMFPGLGAFLFLGLVVLLVFLLVVPAIVTPILNFVLPRLRSNAARPYKRIRYVDVFIPFCLAMVILLFIGVFFHGRHRQGIDQIQRFRALAENGSTQMEELRAQSSNTLHRTDRVAPAARVQR